MKLIELIILSLTLPIIFEWYILHFAPISLITFLYKYNILKDMREINL